MLGGWGIIEWGNNMKLGNCTWKLCINRNKKDRVKSKRWQSVFNENFS